ncbi:MAG TPA: bifunctional riboflavin kinase/FAD synthetase [Bryobacteraceae bacterium]|nr:bifunctional riboflavin kinase/FAD synthetase [Bryobacteraceae bacterium]
MLVFRSHEEVPPSFGPSAVTIGNFDGVHGGHREIMRRVVALGRERGLTPTVLTFDPHPARVLAPERAPKLIMTIGQRLRAMEAEGIEAVLILPFSLEFARLSPAEFAARILQDSLHAQCVLVGEDFRFGYKQAGNIDTLREWFEVRPVTAVERRGERISSSAIRRLLSEGAVSRACRMLGAPFALEGQVVKGQGIGSKQTVPTLNLAPENEVLPKTGVYVTRTRDLGSSRTWPSVTNVGYRPTFDGDGLTVETFLLEPVEGETPARIEVQFLKFIREERKFEDAAALRARILKDAAFAARLHRRL